MGAGAALELAEVSHLSPEEMGPRRRRLLPPNSRTCQTRCGSCWTAEPWTTHSPRRGAGRAAGKGCLPAEVEKCDALKQQLPQAVETRAQDLAVRSPPLVAGRFLGVGLNAK